MYKGKYDPVPLPTIGHLHILKTGYVIWNLDSKWNKLKGYADEKRYSIGKLVEGSSTHMYPNECYFERVVPLLAAHGAVDEPDKAPILTNSSDDDSPTELPGSFSYELCFGVYTALKQAVDKIGCLDALKTAFPECWEKIFAVAVHAADAQNSTAQDFPGWCYLNYCGLPRPLSDSELSALFREIADGEGIRDFLALFRESYRRRMPGAAQHAVAFDSTNQNTSSEGIVMAEYGHAKKDEQLPVVNTALFVDEETGIPLYYEHFYGSLLDGSQTPFTLENAQDLGFKKLFIMMDRAYCNKDCLRAYRDLEFAVMCPDSFSLVKELINAHAATIRNVSKYYIMEEDVYGLHIPGTVYDGVAYDAYLYYDAARAEEERKSIHGRLRYFMSRALKRKRYSKRLAETFAPWLTITKIETKDQNGIDFTVEVNHAKVQECLNNAGLFVVLSNTGRPANQIITIARGRDRGEKSFKRLKDHFDLNKTYCHTQATYEGKMFTAFIALVAVESYRWFIAEILRAKSSETTATTFAELRKYQIRQRGNGAWSPVYALTAKMKKIYVALSLTKSDVEDAARAVKTRSRT